MTDLDRLLAFAAGSRTPDGFGYLTADGTVDPARGIETWINGRMTHVFSLAVLLGREDLRALAEHGVQALQGPLRDRAHGGWFSKVPGDPRKLAYQHAFVILAGASATQADIAGGRQLLDDALQVWDERFWDDAVGAAVDEWDASWTTLSPYRGANANMHGVEAMLAAADALDHQDLRDRCLRVVARFVHQEAGVRDWRLPEHFDADWKVLLDHNVDAPADPFQPYGVTVGHQLEWARLALHLESVLADPPPWLRADAHALYAVAKERGWAVDGHDGFVYTLDWEDRPVVTARMHWVVAEAISAAAVLGHDKDLRAWQQHAEALFADPLTGSWHHELSADGTVATGTWGGKPDAYHVVQALLLPGSRPAGSLAHALKEKA